MSDVPNSPRILKWSSRLCSSSPSRPSFPVHSRAFPDLSHSRGSGLSGTLSPTGWAEARDAPCDRPNNALKQVLDTSSAAAFHQARSATWGSWVHPSGETTGLLDEHSSVIHGSGSTASLSNAPSLSLIPASPTIGESNAPNTPAMTLEAPDGCSEPAPGSWVAVTATYDRDRLTPAQWQFNGKGEGNRRG